VHQADSLTINVKPDQTVYAPGAEGKIRFEVTDAAGKPTAAALGVLVVDEAVYALQDMQPGLEKVYFTLQEELVKPQAQAVYRPAETIEVLVRQPELLAQQQQIAQVLLTSIKPKPPARWDVSPMFERRRQVEGQFQQFGWAVYQYALNSPSFMDMDKKTQSWSFKPGLLEDVVKSQGLQPALLNDPFGKKWTLEGLARLEKNFTVD